MSAAVKVKLLGRVAVTLLLPFTIGLFFAVLPLATAAGFEYADRLQSPNFMDAVATGLKNFLLGFLGFFAFGYALGGLQAILVGIVLAGFGLLTSGVGKQALSISVVVSLAAGVMLFWRGLWCQCHPNVAGKLFLIPGIFVACHFFLAASSWAVARNIWRNQWRPV